MDDFYTEQMIKKQADSKDTLKKVGLIALTVVSVLLVFVIPVGIILPVVMIVIDVLMFRNLERCFCRCRSDGTSGTGRGGRINAV